jgi:hypothetical protein
MPRPSHSSRFHHPHYIGWRVPQGLIFKNSTWCSLCVECFVRIWDQTSAFVLYVINWLVFKTVVESVYSAVRTDSLYKADCV